MEITAAQKHKLKKFVNELKLYRANHTELVTVYIPAGYELNKIIGHLYEEQGTASNIKSASTRKNVQAALERMIQHLKLYKQTPPNGLAVFSGNVAAREGQQDVKVWSVEPPMPIGTRLYRCDKEFVLDILEQMLEERSIYGLVVIDRRDADIALLKGKTIIPLAKTHSHVPGKFKAGGQCLVKDSLVQLSDGSILPIEVIHNPGKVISFMIMNNGSIQDSRILDKWSAKKNVVYKIVTKCPRIEVQASAGHTFFVASQEGIIEKAASELKEDDYLIMPEKIEVKSKEQILKSKQHYNSFIINKEGQNLLIRKRKEKGLLQKELAKRLGVTQTTISSYEIGKLNSDSDQLGKLCRELGIDFNEFLDEYTKPRHHQGVTVILPEKLNSIFAQFLGYILGDGSVEVDRITLFEQDKQVALEYKRKFDKFFNLQGSYRFRESKNYHQIKFTSRPLVRLIQAEFPELKRKLKSEIPQRLLQSDNNILAAFLRGLFDAEGYVSGKKAAIGMNNQKLIQQVQMALLRFGVISSFLEYDNKRNIYSKNARYTLEMSEKESLELFRKNIGFTSSKKQKKLNLIIGGRFTRSHVRQIIVPGTLVRKIIENAGYNLQLFPKVNNFFRNERMISKQVFKSSIMSCVKDKKLYKKLQEMYNYPLLPVKIKKIEIIKRPERMIDISVGNKNFIVNGIIVHNSAQRFARIIEGEAKNHYRKVAEYMKEQLLPNIKNLKGIIVGGPGPTKHDFLEEGQVTNELKKKIIAVKDLSYTGDFGLQELVDKSQDVLAQEEIAAEKAIMAEFFNRLGKAEGKVSYGKKHVEDAIKTGAVDIVLLSESLNDEMIEHFTSEAEKMGSKVVIISTETREGAQLRDMGGVAALLRFAVHSE